MALIDWSSEYSVGIEAFDADHIILISLANYLDDCHSRGMDQVVIGGVLSALLTYVDTHFRREEELMERTNYAQLAQHREEHAQLARQIEDLRAKHESGAGAADLTREVLDLLNVWLLDHILEVDMRYKPFFRSLGA